MNMLSGVFLGKGARAAMTKLMQARLELIYFRKHGFRYRRGHTQEAFMHLLRGSQMRNFMGSCLTILQLSLHLDFHLIGQKMITAFFP